MLAPDGSLLGRNQDWLSKSPFSTYLLPGVLLFIFLGLFPILGCIGLLWPRFLAFPERLNLFKDKHWSWAFSLYSGLMAMMWIIVQQFMAPYFWLQSLILLVTWCIVLLCLLPGIQAKLSTSKMG